MNKVQKIREEVERLKSQLLRGACSSQIAMETRCKEEAYNEVLTILDTMQEESVSGNIDFEQELYKAFGQVKDFTLGMQIAKRFYDMGKNSKEHVSEDKLEGLRNAFRLALDDEEPVSDDLEETAYHNCIDRLSKESIEEFKAGAKWQKGQMMAKAIDAELLEGHLIRQKKVTHPLHVGDKVKVIVIKEDEL